MTSNPKLVNSGIIDCVPQVGKCTINCPDCFFNLHYQDYNLPIWPDANMVNEKGLIVRVNSVHDSSKIPIPDNERIIKDYENHFYNTRNTLLLGNHLTCSPVVFTWHGNTGLFLEQIENNVKQIMFIRLMIHREHFFHKPRLDKLKVTQDILHEMGIPTVATFMRYPVKPPGEFEQLYRAAIHLKHSYWVVKEGILHEFMSEFQKTGMLTCGRSYSAYCVDCGNCERLYWRWVRLYT